MANGMVTNDLVVAPAVGKNVANVEGEMETDSSETNTAVLAASPHLKCSPQEDYLALLKLYKELQESNKTVRQDNKALMAKLRQEVQAKQAMADLTNGFQNGSIGATLGINVTTMAMQEPIYVPQPEDLPPQCNWQDEDPTAECYLDPSDNAQDGVLWSEASQANATAKLEENLKVTELKQPKKLMVMTEPSGAFEMQPFEVQPEIYAVDQDGKYIGTVGAVFSFFWLPVPTAPICSLSG